MMLEKIIEIIANRIGVDISSVNPNTNILEFDIDSLDVLNIIMDIEYSFSVRFDDDEIIEIRTPKDIEKALMKKFS